MKVRDSGMPDEAIWEAFFQPLQILESLGLCQLGAIAVEFGCGYGTFTIPWAKTTGGIVHAFDIEEDMLARTSERAAREGLTTVCTHKRDFIAAGTGLADNSSDAAALFNILHAENPNVLCGEAFRVLRPGGRLGIIHWRCDVPTPRGPALDIRPRPAQCRNWAEKVGFVCDARGEMILPPYHYGISFTKP